MPIDKKEFKNGSFHSKVEEEITSFLNERKERAFMSQEIMEGMDYPSDFNTLEIAKMSAFAIANFSSLLYDLVRRGKIEMKFVRGRMYFIAGRDYVAKCPKCGVKIAEPKKTWKMAGRPDKKGKRLQLHIGLFKCPRHGSFRAVLAKQKI